jgi:hypothetical protein
MTPRTDLPPDEMPRPALWGKFFTIALPPPGTHHFPW